MKTITTLLILLIAMTSLATVTDDRSAATQKLAEELKVALQQESPEKYMELFPSLQDFCSVMKKNEYVYGSYLKDAQEAFGMDYSSLLVPMVYQSFSSLLECGKAKGIHWPTVSIYPQQSMSKTGAITFDVISNGKVYSLILEKPLWINGQLKVSQFVRWV
jgi:hypothetical protein